MNEKLNKKYWNWQCFEYSYRKNNHPEMRPSSALRGGFVMMSKSGGLKPKAVAGRPSVTLNKARIV